MITVVRCGYIFLLKNLKLLLSSKIIKTLLRKRQGFLFIVYAQIRVESSLLMSSMSFAKLMVLAGSSLQPTLRNKME